MIEVYPLPDGMRLHPLRATDLTASAIGAVLGLDPYASPLRVYGEKTGAILAESENAAMRRGRWMEAAAVSALRETFPDWDIRPATVYLRDPDVRLGATPDCIAEDPDDPGLVNIQIKTISKPVYLRDWSDDRIPMHYRLQTLCEGYLLDAVRSLVAVLVIDTYTANLELRDVPRYPAAEAKLRQVAADFWFNIATGRRPVPDYARDAETVAALYPTGTPGLTIDLTRDNHLPVILRERALLKTRVETDERRITAIETEIKDKLGNAETGELPGWKLTWKTQARKAYSVPATTSRPLRVIDLAAKEDAA